MKIYIISKLETNDGGVTEKRPHFAALSDKGCELPYVADEISISPTPRQKSLASALAEVERLPQEAQWALEIYSNFNSVAELRREANPELAVSAKQYVYALVPVNPPACGAPVLAVYTTPFDCPENCTLQKMIVMPDAPTLFKALADFDDRHPSTPEVTPEDLRRAHEHELLIDRMTPETKRVLGIQPRKYSS